MSVWSTGCLRKWRANATLTPMPNPHRRESFFTRPVLSTQVHTDLRRRILRAFVGRGLIEQADAKEMLAYQHSEPGSDKRGAKADELHLTPLELIARIAALVPPPRTHRHRYFGVLAPNSSLRATVTALATPAQPANQVASCRPSHPT